MIKFYEMTDDATIKQALKDLRFEIVLNSLYVNDYENPYGITKESCCNFFDGFMSFINELAEEDFAEQGIVLDGSNDCFWKIMGKYDNEDYLLDWYYCFEDDPFEYIEVEDE